MLVGGGGGLGNVRNDFLIVEKRPLPLTSELRVVFKGGVAHVLELPRVGGTGHNWGSLGEQPPPPPPTNARRHPIVGPPGVLTQAGPPSILVTHCSPLYCDRPRFTTAALGHLVLQRPPPVSERGGGH